MTRTCSTCNETKPIELFARYRTGKYAGYRYECKACVRLYRKRWEITLTPEREARYHAKKEATDRAYREKRAARVARETRERRQFLRNLIQSMKADGMTNDVIADIAGVHVRTIRRIISPTDSRVVFRRPTEDKIVSAYARLKGIEA